MTIEQCTKVLEDLQRQRREKVDQESEAALHRKEISYAALVDNDAKAKKKLESINKASIERATELESLDAAIAEAEHRLAAAQAEANKAAAIEAAKEQRKLFDRLVERYLDDFRYRSNAKGRAFESLDAETREQIRREEVAMVERKIAENNDHDGPARHEAPYAHYHAQNLKQDFSKDSNMPDFISMTKAINKADGQVSNLTQAGYLAMGREKFGKAVFDKMMVENKDIFNAVSALHANDVRKWSAKYHGTPPSYTQADVEPELAKIRKAGPGDGWSQWWCHTCSH
jgi:hypothetical protein